MITPIALARRIRQMEKLKNDPVKYAAHLAKMKEYHRRKRAEGGEEYLAKRKEASRKTWQSLTPEQREKKAMGTAKWRKSKRGVATLEQMRREREDAAKQRLEVRHDAAVRAARVIDMELRIRKAFADMADRWNARELVRYNQEAGIK